MRSNHSIPNDKTVILLGGLSILHDELIASALKSTGGEFINLPTPDFESFEKGKTYGSRGQCNPAYFTVGNLIKYLEKLHKEGLSHEYIIEHYIFFTAMACGPCRFGMYITEYKKALNDAGFNGFRVLSFENNRGIFQKSEDYSIIHFTPIFFIKLLKAILIGDILNLLKHKLRPYELEKGSTNRAIELSREIISNTFLEDRNLLIALYRCQKILKSVKIDSQKIKPKVLIIGEFWATITEGDGNYNLHKFLEEKGAESTPQPLINHLLLTIWESKYHHKKTIALKSTTKRWIEFSSFKMQSQIFISELLLRLHFKLYAKIVGLKGYSLPNMERLARLASEYYPIDSNGGEGHLEVAHLLDSIQKQSAHLVISVKPFGCMPSSSVSDGIQSLVTSRFPNANFLSVETSGESSVNFYSRVEMALHRAKKLLTENFNKK